MKITGMTVYGDSIGKGVVWSAAHGRYRITREGCVRLLSKCLPFPVENRSVMGCTVRSCLDSLDVNDLRPGQVTVFEFGSNDSDMDWDAVARTPGESHTARVPVEEFEEDLKRLVRLARSRGAYPVLTTPIPLVAQRYFLWVSRSLDRDAILRYLGDPVQMARWQERWSHAVERAAAAERVPLVDLRDAMLRCLRFEKMYCEDGIHPNEAGQRYLFEAVRDAYLPFRRLLDEAV